MRIKRVTNPVEFSQLIDDLQELFAEEDIHGGHQLLRHDAESIKKSFAHSGILAWHLFVWGHKNGDKFDAAIMFFNDLNPKFGKRIFTEFLWLSRNGAVGVKLFDIATKFAREQGIEYLSMSTVVANPKHDKVKAFYTAMGFLKDSETYICKL